MAALAPWVVVTLAAAVSQAGYEVLQKRLTASVDTLRLSYVTAALGTVLLAPVGTWLVATRSLAERRFLLVGGATTLRSVLVFAAFALVAAAKATVVLRVSLVLTVLAGGTLFAEGGVGRRLLGAGLVVAGVWLAL